MQSSYFKVTEYTRRKLNLFNPYRPNAPLYTTLASWQWANTKMFLNYTVSGSSSEKHLKGLKLVSQKWEETGTKRIYRKGFWNKFVGGQNRIYILVGVNHTAFIASIWFAWCQLKDGRNFNLIGKATCNYHLLYGELARSILPRDVPPRNLIVCFTKWYDSETSTTKHDLQIATSILIVCFFLNYRISSIKNIIFWTVLKIFIKKIWNHAYFFPQVLTLQYIQPCLSIPRNAFFEL